jgi:putative ABC transport system substrate-binding protein
MRRRDFIAIAGGAVTWPFASRAQQPIRGTPLIGVLSNSVESDLLYRSYLQAFVLRLRDLGWIDGKNIRVDIRWNDGDAKRAQAIAAELVRLAPDVLVAASTTNLRALHRLTSSIPVVFVQVSDPVAQGFVASLARPGGNITGFSAFEFSIGSKWVELLKDTVPGLARVGVMFNPDTSPQTKHFLRAIESAASKFGIQVVSLAVRTDNEVEQKLEQFASEPGSGLIFPTDSFIRIHEEMIMELVARNRLPIISGNTGTTGGLMYYGSDVDLAQEYRQVADYVDRILRGAKPTQLPVQLSARYRLVVNAKTATSLGIKLPPSLLDRADEVIE